MSACFSLSRCPCKSLPLALSAPPSHLQVSRSFLSAHGVILLSKCLNVAPTTSSYVAHSGAAPRTPASITRPRYAAIVCPAAIPMHRRVRVRLSRPFSASHAAGSISAGPRLCAASSCCSCLLLSYRPAKALEEVQWREFSAEIFAKKNFNFPISSQLARQCSRGDRLEERAGHKPPLAVLPWWQHALWRRIIDPCYSPIPGATRQGSRVSRPQRPRILRNATRNAPFRTGRAHARVFRIVRGSGCGRSLAIYVANARGCAMGRASWAFASSLCTCLLGRRCSGRLGTGAVAEGRV